MKKLLIILCALCCLTVAGCTKTDENDETADTNVNETEDISESETTAEEETVPMPEVFLALRDADIAHYPDDFSPDEEFVEAVSAELAEKLPDLPICARVVYIYSWAENEIQRYSIDCEIYPIGAEIRLDNLLYSPFNIELVRTEDGYIVSTEPAWIDEEAPEAVRENYEKYSSDERETTDDSEYLHLDKENRVILHLESGDVRTEMICVEGVYSLENINLYYVDGDTILICGQRDNSTPFTISVSRDGGETWHTETPTLERLEANGFYSEAGFSVGKIQMKEDGDFYIFLGAGLASVTILKIPSESDEINVLFHELIEGYAETALKEAAMVTDTLGFFTLNHPKADAANAIYRTTDSGETWVRCGVPMPDECRKAGEMTLYLPYQTKEENVWYMKGVWGNGECVYISEDDGLTWGIMEITLS